MFIFFNRNILRQPSPVRGGEHLHSPLVQGGATSQKELGSDVLHSLFFVQVVPSISEIMMRSYLRQHNHNSIIMTSYMKLWIMKT